MNSLFSKISELQSQNETFCIVTVVKTAGETPRKAGARGIIFPDGTIEGTIGGGSIEAEVTAVAQKVIESGKPLLTEYPLEQVQDGMMCGGSMTVFFEPVFPQRRITIFGGGHVGRAIAHASHIAGWQITVVDNRQDILNPQFFPPGAQLITMDYLEYTGNNTFDRNDWLVIVTPKHKYDEHVLESLVRSDAAYIGMMGSRTKITQIMNHLKDKGIGEKFLNKVYTPIGLNIGTETPGEIAISIVAEMLAVYNKLDDITFSKNYNIIKNK